MNFGKFASVKGKTTLYFSLVLSLAIFLTGGSCYYFFSKIYCASMENQNDIRLQALSNQLDGQVFRFVKHQLLELTENHVVYKALSSLLKDPETQRNLKIFNTVDELKSLVTFSNGIIDSVDIYCPNSKISVSSLSGYTDLSPEPPRADRLLWEKTAQDWKNNYWWDVRQINANNNTNIICFNTFPAGFGNNAKGLIAVSLNPSILDPYIGILETEETKYFLLDYNRVFFYGGMRGLNEYLGGRGDEALGRIIHMGNDGTVHRVNTNQGGVTVSYIHSREIPIILLSVMSTRSLRAGMDKIMTFIIVIGIGVFLTGLIPSGLFSRKLYTPLSQLLVSLENLPTNASNLSFRNEYLYINHAVDQLYQKAIEYERTFNEYLNIIVNDFKTALNSRDINGVSIILEHFRSMYRNSSQTNDHVRAYMAVLIDVFYAYVKNANLEKFDIEGKLIGGKSIEGKLKIETQRDLASFCDTLRGTVARAFEYAGGQKKTLLVSKLLDYIRVNLSAPISLESTAEHCGISSSYASKLIREETGRSFSDCLNKFRLEAALILLGDSSLKVEDIAAKTGFGGAAYFIKRFKTRYGVTPKAWRLQKNIGGS
jgi:AraC-like DNA-binding protein